MPKAILEFRIPEEEEEYRVAVDGPKYQNSLWEFAKYLRDSQKYAEHKPDFDVIEQKFREILADNNVDFK